MSIPATTKYLVGFYVVITFNNKQDILLILYFILLQAEQNDV